MYVSAIAKFIIKNRIKISEIALGLHYMPFLSSENHSQNHHRRGGYFNADFAEEFSHRMA